MQGLISEYVLLFPSRTKRQILPIRNLPYRFEHDCVALALGTGDIDFFGDTFAEFNGETTGSKVREK